MVLFSGAYGQTVITAGNDTTICIGGTASLTGTVISGSYGTTSYTFEPIAYLPEPFSGGTGVMFDADQDDRIAGPFDIGFSFCFFNQTYTQFYIGSNGWVGFSFNNAWTTFTAQPIPNTNDAVPKNCIMAPWQDWWPGWTPDGQNNGINVFYYLTGTEPNRKLVVYWTNCPLYNCTDQITKRGTFQIVLNEQNSIIENHIQKKPNCSNSENATQGVHNSDGTIAFTADGRNCTPWTATNESTRFVPSGIRWFVGGYPGGTVVGYGPELIVSPTTTTTYTVAVESCGGGTATDDVTVTVVDATFNYSPSVFCSNDPDPTPATLQPVGTFTGTPSGLVIDPANGTIDITASTSGTYQVTHTITTPCLTSFSQTITLNPSPAEPQPLQDSVFRCGPGDLSFSVVPQPGETYSWYDAPVAGNKLGTGSTLVRNMTTTTTLWVESQTIASTCISTSRASVTGVVNPIPSITNITTSFTQCDDLPFDVAFTSDVTGALFTWTCTPSSATITGWSDNAIPAASLNQTLNNTGNLPESVIYHVTPIADGCTGIATNFTVTVQPTPVLLNTPLATSICSGISPSISLTSNVAGALFTWTCTPSSPNITGWSPSAAPGILIDQVLTNLGTNSENVVYHITPAANGCSGLLTDYTVTVNPPPDVSFNPPGQIICSQQTSNIQLLSTVSSATFSWTVTSSSPNLSGQLPGSGTSIAQTILNSGATVEALTYTVTPSTAGCPPGTPANVILTVKPTPVITNGVTSFQICSGSSAEHNPGS